MKKKMISLFLVACMLLCVSYASAIGIDIESMLQDKFATEPVNADQVISYGKWETSYLGIVLTYEFFSNGYMTMTLGTETTEGTTFPGLYKVTGSEMEMYIVGAGGTISNRTVPALFDGTNLYIDGEAYTLNTSVVGKESSSVSRVADMQKKIDELATQVQDLTAELDKAREEAAKAASRMPVKVMTHDEFMKADLDSIVCVEAYVQASQSWWNGTIKLYLQDENHGGYYAYDVPCTEEEAAQLAVPGTKVRIKGTKIEWQGEVEIIDSTYEFLDGFFIAEPEDVTDLFDKDELIDHMNEKIMIKGAKVVPSIAADGTDGLSFLYGWDGSGSKEINSDIYFNVELNGIVYCFYVESNMCDSDTDVYAAVENLKIGDIIDCEGFLCWYNGPNPAITNVTVK